MRNYYEECKEILKSFQLVILQHIPRENNGETNRLAQSASSYRENQELFAIDVYAFGSDLTEDDWRKEIADYLENPSRTVSRKLGYKAIKFVLLDGHLYYISMDGVLLQCLGQEEVKRMMSEVHDGLLGAHQSAYRMKWSLGKLDVIGRQCWRIALNITRGVKIFRSVEIFREFQHQL
jgi:hypothetical protein